MEYVVMASSIARPHLVRQVSDFHSLENCERIAVEYHHDYENCAITIIPIFDEEQREEE